MFPGKKSSLPRPIDRAVDEAAVVNGVSRLHRSDNGCPIVDISQLQIGQ